MNKPNQHHPFWLSQYEEEGGQLVATAATAKAMASIIRKRHSADAYCHIVTEWDNSELDAYGCGEIVEQVNADEWIQEQGR